MGYLTTGEAAAVLGISHNTVRGYADAGYLPCSKTAKGHRRFLESDVLAYLAGRQAPEKPHAEVRAELWRKTTLAVLRSAVRDLGASTPWLNHSRMLLLSCSAPGGSAPGRNLGGYRCDRDQPRGGAMANSPYGSPKPTWEERDLPILEAYAVLLQNSGRTQRGGVDPRAAGYVEGFTQDEILESLWVLNQAGYIEAIASNSLRRREIVVVTDLTERGRRAVGIWPSEDPGEHLLRAIDAKLQQSPDDPDSGKLRKIREELASVATGTLTGIATAAARAGLGL